jgi:branched-chain amino acid transport system permease protein
MNISIPTPLANARWGRPLGLVGGALVVGSGLMSWSFDPGLLGDLTFNLAPGGIQVLAMVLAGFALLVRWGSAWSATWCW